MESGEWRVEGGDFELHGSASYPKQVEVRSYATSIVCLDLVNGNDEAAELKSKGQMRGSADPPTSEVR